jgi:hypothetical protein
MAIELTRLAFGLLLLCFHRSIADYILIQERALVVLFRQRGIPLPSAPGTETARNIYFLLGAFVVLYQLARIWLALHS